MNRFEIATPRLLATVLEAMTHLGTVNAALHPDESAQTIAATLALALQSATDLLEWIETANTSRELEPAIRTLHARLCEATTNRDHDGIFDVVAMPRFDTWPTAAAPQTFYGNGEIVYGYEDELGAIYGHPELRDDHLFLWHYDPRLAAAHLSALHARKALRPEGLH